MKSWQCERNLCATSQDLHWFTIETFNVVIATVDGAPLKVDFSAVVVSCGDVDIDVCIVVCSCVDVGCFWVDVGCSWVDVGCFCVDVGCSCVDVGCSVVVIAACSNREKFSYSIQKDQWNLFRWLLKISRDTCHSRRTTNIRSLEIARGKQRTQSLCMFCENCFPQNFRDFSSRDLATIPYFWAFLMLMLALTRVNS